MNETTYDTAGLMYLYGILFTGFSLLIAALLLIDKFSSKEPNAKTKEA